MGKRKPPDLKAYFFAPMNTSSSTFFIRSDNSDRKNIRSAQLPLQFIETQEAVPKSNDFWDSPFAFYFTTFV
ncbi:hypothetical protein DFQ01_11571 [Paenibacillus cellulosilyticus]|uniref:Uncharacterized protein n=1 Tax=Paenibacillus cellulosilyticus TaxID=375489 RepID=A0A2V2YRW3_9BACL|nr:hypothetical protein DFQ01_11571 [Paenibacillus cellulosilyticus]